MERVVIALGGNALGATAEEQRAAITKASAPPDRARLRDHRHPR
jgi:carbamate kinase